MKRLDSFMLQRFVPLLLMTFFIVLFILMMQYLFRIIDDLVGKGLSFDVLGELFFYAALSMVPTALPLAVLLASLMVFGNLGEKLELTAMKAAGISLFRIMAPLIVFIGLLAVGAFFFQNYVQPVTQTKMWTLMFSVRQKSPEVEIPERSFYGDIPGMSMYVESKNPDTGMLYGMIMYDVSRGSDNVRVILADSGKFNFTEDKTRLFLHLYSGEMFENLNNNNAMGMGTGGYMPFRRESFSDKQVYFAFDANFNRMDEEGIRSQYVGQNISQLRHSMDSLQHKVDSIGAYYGRDLLTANWGGVVSRHLERDSNGRMSTAPAYDRASLARASANAADIVLDSVFAYPGPNYTKSYIQQALSATKRSLQDYEYRSMMLTEQARLMRRHDIEYQRKFTFSLVILVFFFIGAPLGSIIKKGGIGTPLVISIFLFIIYYIFENTGYKMARDGRMAVWQGMWLSTAAMAPLGIYFTIKAIDDSAVFNADTYRLALQRLIGKRQKRNLSLKEVVIEHVQVPEALERLHSLRQDIQHYADTAAAHSRLWRWTHWLSPHPLAAPLAELVDYLSNSQDKFVIYLLNTYPVTPRLGDLPQMLETTDRLIKQYTQSHGAED